MSITEPRAMDAGMIRDGRRIVTEALFSLAIMVADDDCGLEEVALLVPIGEAASALGAPGEPIYPAYRKWDRDLADSLRVAISVALDRAERGLACTGQGEESEFTSYLKSLVSKAQRIIQWLDAAA